MQWIKRVGAYVVAILIALAVADGALELYVRNHLPSLPTVQESPR